VQQWLPAIQIIEIILSIAVIVLVLLQARSTGLGSAFGGGSAGSVFKTRRGIERLVFNLTVIFIVLWALIAVFSAAVVGRLLP
jgi:preprotein translocase subunit SecG